MDFSGTYTVNKMYDKMQNKLLSVTDKHAPMKGFTNKETLKCKPWMNKKIIKLKKKNQIYKKYT